MLLGPRISRVEVSAAIAGKGFVLKPTANIDAAIVFYKTLLLEMS